MTYCPLIIHILRIISGRCIPISLRSKTRRRQHFYFLQGLLGSIDRDEQLRTSLRQSWRFQFPYYTLSVLEWQHPIFVHLRRFDLIKQTSLGGKILIFSFTDSTDRIWFNWDLETIKCAERGLFSSAHLNSWRLLLVFTVAYLGHM